MSENNREGKRTARERLREERARDRARTKRKRTAVVAGGIAAVLAAAAVAGVVIADRRTAPAGGPAAAPSGATGKSDLAIPVGAANAPSTLTVYEDFRCPACNAFEHAYRDAIHALTDSGRLKVEYHVVRLIDGNLGGTGSLDAGVAAACAQQAGRFRDYHDVLYDNQPEERDDKFADKAYLARLAGMVPGLRSAAFTSCLDRGTYNAWINKSDSDFAGAGFGSTPTVLLNGRNVYADRRDPLTPDRLRQLVAEHDKGRPAGSPAPSAG